MLELKHEALFGEGLTSAEVTATRGDPTNPLRLPDTNTLATHTYATAERRRDGPVEVRLWVSRDDAISYMHRREREPEFTAGAVFSILPSMQPSQTERRNL